MTEPEHQRDPTYGAPASGEVQSRALRGSIWGLVSSLAGVPLQMVATIVLAHRFGPAGFGRYAVCAFVVPTVYALSDLGMTSALLQRAARAFGENDRERFERTSGQALSWCLVRWPFLLLGLSLFLQDAWASAALGVAAIAIVSCSGVGVALIASVRIAELSRLVLVATVASTAVTVASATLGGTPTQVFAFGYATQYSLLVLQVRLLRSDPHWRRACFRPRSLRSAGPDLAFGAASYASEQMVSLTLSRSELLFFPGSASRARGTYAAAWTLGSRLTLPIDALYGSLTFSLAAISGRGEVSTRATQRALRLSASLFLLCSAPAILFAVLGADLLFPSTYKHLAFAAAVLAGTSLAVSAANPVVATYFANRRVKPQFAAAAIALTANILLSLFLIRKYGLAGAVGANAASALVYVGLLIVPLLRRGTALSSAMADYIKSVGASITVAVALGIGVVATLDEGPARWFALAALAVAQPVVSVRLLPAMDLTDIEMLRGHVAPRFAWSLSLLARVTTRTRTLADPGQSGP